MVFLVRSQVQPADTTTAPGDDFDRQVRLGAVSRTDGVQGFLGGPFDAVRRDDHEFRVEHTLEPLKTQLLAPEPALKKPVQANYLFEAFARHHQKVAHKRKPAPVERVSYVASRFFDP